MNTLEKEMINVLKKLKNDYGCFQIKAEFEAEGTRMSELQRLKDVTCAVGLPIIMKIGGVESVTDVYNCLLVGVDGIVAPMVETPYACFKYGKMIETIVAPDNIDDIDFYFNLETVTGYNNRKDIFNLPIIKNIDGVTVGRSDMAGSLGLSKSDVNSEKIFNISRDIFLDARAHNLKTAIGGNITAASIDFLNNLNSENLIDKFETRKVVFANDSIKYGKDAFNAALKFELIWLQSKQRLYSDCKKEDENRILDLKKRLSI